MSEDCRRRVKVHICRANPTSDKGRHRPRCSSDAILFRDLDLRNSKCANPDPPGFHFVIESRESSRQHENNRHMSDTRICHHSVPPGYAPYRRSQYPKQAVERITRLSDPMPRPPVPRVTSPDATLHEHATQKPPSRPLRTASWIGANCNSGGNDTADCAAEQLVMYRQCRSLATPLLMPPRLNQSMYVLNATYNVSKAMQSLVSIVF
jgi:hypothetical protein